MQTDPRKIQELLHKLSVHSNREARMLVEILVVEAADERAKRFGDQMEKLPGITEAQGLLAQKLDRQTETVIKTHRDSVSHTKP